MNVEDVKNKQLYIMLSKNKPCCDCNKKFHYSSMQYDHIEERGPKLFEIGNGVKIKNTLEEIKEEIKKCDLVCANCHMKRTFLRSLSEFSKESLPNKELEELSNEDLIIYFNDKRQKRRNSPAYKDYMKKYNKNYREKQKATAEQSSLRVKTMGNVEVEL